MGTGIWVSPSGTARKVKNIYVGVNGTARKVKKMWIGVSGTARLCYTAEVDTQITVYGGINDEFRFTYNGVTYSKIVTNGTDYWTFTVPMEPGAHSITFYSEIAEFSKTVSITAGIATSVYVRPDKFMFWYGVQNIESWAKDADVSVSFEGRQITLRCTDSDSTFYLRNSNYVGKQIKSKLQRVSSVGNYYWDPTYVTNEGYAHLQLQWRDSTMLTLIVHCVYFD